jgi:hypothetical protein
MRSLLLFTRFLCSAPMYLSKTIAILLLVASGSLFPSGAVAQGSFERILIPVYVPEPLPGAHGSLWVSEFVAFNGTSQPVSFVFADDICPVTCPFQALPPGEVVHHTLRPITDSVGRFYHLSREAADGISLNLRIRDLSRQRETWGTEIPVVRERDFLNERSVLVNVPIASRFRSMLRVYDVDASGTAFAHVRIIGAPEGQPDQLLYETLLPLPVEESERNVYNDISAPVPFRPGIGTLLLDPILEELFGSQMTDLVTRIEISPAGGNFRFWAFVSVTNNETQHVTTITPQ